MNSLKTILIVFLLLGNLFMYKHAYAQDIPGTTLVTNKIKKGEAGIYKLADYSICSSMYYTQNDFSYSSDTAEANFDTVLTYSIENYREVKPPIITMSIKNKLWKITKYQSRKGLLVKDSIINYDCINCQEVFNKIISLGLLDLPDESELSHPCKSYQDTIINGNKVTEIHDLSSIADIDLYKIEFKIGTSKKILLYRNPYTALTICPYSDERIKLIKIINLIKNL